MLRQRADTLTPGQRAPIEELAETNERVYRGWLLCDQLRVKGCHEEGLHDLHVPVLRAMHARRLRTYKSLGFTRCREEELVLAVAG